MQPWLARIAELEGAARLSFKDGRRGWLVTSRLDLISLRQRLHRHCARVNEVHAAQGRFFLEPRPVYFRRALRGLRLDLPENFLTPRRRERLRRLRPFLRVKAHQPDHRSESRLFHSLALRLDGLSDAVKPEKIWKHVGHDFDRLWKRAPLFAVELTGFQVDVLKALSGQDPSLI